MKILFLTSALPHHNVVSGFVVIYNRIRLLAQRGHKVGVACFVSEEDRVYIPEVESSLSELVTLPIPQTGTVRQTADHVISQIPSDFRDLRSEEMRMTVGRMVERSHYDVVVAEFSSMGQNLYWNPRLPAVKRIISCHTCYTTAVRNRLRVQQWSLRWLKTYLALGKLQRFEFNMYRSADHVITLTPEEKIDLHHYAPDLRISVSPYGVDPERYKPAPDATREDCIVYTGFFRDVANQDAVQWFIQNVWPELKVRFPKLRFYVVGRSPTRYMQEIGRKDPRVVITGEVPAMEDYLARAKVYVCPVRLGKGLRGKILQAMSAGVPVVSTTLGAEGIAAQNGHNIILADTPHTTVEGISLLLQESTLRKSMSESARKLVVSHYSWDHCIDLLEEVLYKVVE